MTSSNCRDAPHGHLSPQPLRGRDVTTLTTAQPAEPGGIPPVGTAKHEMLKQVAERPARPHRNERVGWKVTGHVTGGQITATEVNGHPTEATLRWAADAIGVGSLVSGVRLMGVSSTTLHAIEVVGPTGLTHQLALRRFHRTQRLETDPWYVPGNEAAVLNLLGLSGVPAPRLIAADTAPVVCDLPTLATTLVPGQPPTHLRDLERLLLGLASTLVQIHAVTGPAVQELPFYRPYFDRTLDGERRPPAWSTQQKMWERAFEIAESPAPRTTMGFIHRDYHPGQTLWADDRLVGVVDWTTGCQGPHGIDLARVRLNLAGRYGVDVAQRFRTLHREIAGYDIYHPHWDLLDAADVIVHLPAPTSTDETFEYNRFEDWVAQAVAALRG